MMISILLAIISGISMSVQGVFNTRLSEKIGTLGTNIIVQGTALLLTLAISIFVGFPNLKEIKGVNKLTLLGGILGVVITYTVMVSIKNMGPTYAIGTILVAQLLAAAAIDAFGLFGTEKISFSFNEFIGIAVMICGIIIFKWK